MLNGKHNNGKQGVKDKVTQKKKSHNEIQGTFTIFNLTDQSNWCWSISLEITITTVTSKSDTGHLIMSTVSFQFALCIGETKYILVCVTPLSKKLRLKIISQLSVTPACCQVVTVLSEDNIILHFARTQLSLHPINLAENTLCFAYKAKIPKTSTFIITWLMQKLSSCCHWWYILVRLTEEADFKLETLPASLQKHKDSLYTHPRAQPTLLYKCNWTHVVTLILPGLGAALRKLAPKWETCEVSRELSPLIISFWHETAFDGETICWVVSVVI